MPAISGKPQGRAGSSTIVQPQNGQAAGAQVSPTLGKSQQIARSLVAVRKQFYTAKDLADPAKLHQVIYQVQQGATTALHALGSNPMSSGVLLAGVVFTAGQTQYLSHGLGRPYTGWVVARVQAAASATASYGALYDVSTDAVSFSPASGAYTQLPLDHAGASSGTTLTTGTTPSITVSTAGSYLISAMLSGKSGSTSAVPELAVFVNGSIANEMQSFGLPTTTGMIFTFATVGVRALNAGDAIDVRMTTATLSATITVETAQLVVSSINGGSPGLVEATLPSSVTSDKQIGLTAAVAGTYSVWVF